MLTRVVPPIADADISCPWLANQIAPASPPPARKKAQKIPANLSTKIKVFNRLASALRAFDSDSVC